MKETTIICDRCHKSKNVTICTNVHGVIIATGGYYDVSYGNWNEYARDNEKKICDDCMHSDPKYMEIYKL